MTCIFTANNIDSIGSDIIGIFCLLRRIPQILNEAVCVCECKHACAWGCMRVHLCLADVRWRVELIQRIAFLLQRHKTKKEVMEEIISKSKFFKVIFFFFWCYWNFFLNEVAIISNLFLQFTFSTNSSRHKKQKRRKKMNVWWKTWTKTSRPWCSLRPYYL